MPAQEKLTPEERAQRSAAQCLESSKHDPLTAELHAEAAAKGITPAALAQTKRWREKLAAPVASIPDSKSQPKPRKK